MSELSRPRRGGFQAVLPPDIAGLIDSEHYVIAARAQSGSHAFYGGDESRIHATPVQLHGVTLCVLVFKDGSVVTGVSVSEHPEKLVPSTDPDSPFEVDRVWAEEVSALNAAVQQYRARKEANHV